MGDPSGEAIFRDIMGVRNPGIAKISDFFSGLTNNPPQAKPKRTTSDLTTREKDALEFARLVGAGKIDEAYSKFKLRDLGGLEDIAVKAGWLEADSVPEAWRTKPGNAPAETVNGIPAGIKAPQAPYGDAFDTPQQETSPAAPEGTSRAFSYETDANGRGGTEPVFAYEAASSKGRTFQEGLVPLQKALKSAGFDLGPDGADGYFGDKTKEAVKAFQKKNGLTPTGILDQRTADLLGGVYE